MLIGITCVNAQVLYYLRKGTTVSEKPYVYTVYIEGKELYYQYASMTHAAAKLHSNSSYYEQYLSERLDRKKGSTTISVEGSRNGDGKYTYCADLSNNTYTVYKSEETSPQAHFSAYGSQFFEVATGGYYYIAISKDKKTMIRWYEYKSSGVSNKTMFYRISTSEFVTDPHDFLK